MLFLNGFSQLSISEHGERLLAFLLVALVCGCQSFDPNTNIETAIMPNPPDDLENVEEYITSIVTEMYPKIGKYQMKIVDKGYTLDFVIGGNQFNVQFDSGGNWERSRVDIRYMSGLPTGILETLRDPTFDGWQMSTRRLFQTPDSIYYKLEFRQKEIEWDLHFDKEGSLLKKQREIKKLITS